MKRTSVIWYILGAIVLVALGFVAGYALNGGFTRVAMMRGATAFPYAHGMMPGLFFGGLGFGLRGLATLVFCLGPVAGIVALIIVLTRRPVAAPAITPVVASEPVAAVEPPAPAETETKPARKK